MTQLYGGPLDGYELDEIQEQILSLLANRSVLTGERQPFAFVRDGKVCYFMVVAAPSPENENHYTGPQ